MGQMTGSVHLVGTEWYRSTKNPFWGMEEHAEYVTIIQSLVGRITYERIWEKLPNNAGWRDLPRDRFFREFRQSYGVGTWVYSPSD